VEQLRVVRSSFGDPAAMDTAVSAAILEEVSNGTTPATLRLHRPPAVVAFGSMDRPSPGFALAVSAALAGGFAPVLRLAGGRAAVFHEGTIGLALARPQSNPKVGIRERFEELSGIVVEALRSLGLDARIGEVPGEYCPGRYSVNVRGRRKLAGVGQRLGTAAVHVGAVVVVSGADGIRDVLERVYAALGIDWEPATVGSVEEEDPAAGWDEVAAAILDAFARRYRLVEGEVEAATLARAGTLVPRFEPDTDRGGVTDG
jgi:octanoyl-[GcvH]:protein N-octanoyltransferase